MSRITTLLVLLCAVLPVRAQLLAVPGAGFPVNVLVQSPALTKTDLQAICLFRPDNATTLNGSLREIDEKLGGLLSQIRKTDLFNGGLGETLVITPKPGNIPARRLLLIGLGDLQSFSPDREQVVGFVFFEEAERLGISDPFFAPTVLDGGKSGVDTGEVAQQFLGGWLRAKASQDLLRHAGVSAGANPRSLTYLAGAAHAQRSRDGLALALRTLHNQKQ
jgi:hypothetical protein